MAQQNINFGRFPSDPSADSLRIAFQKAQNNFTELYNNQAAQVTKVYADRGLTQNRTIGDVTLYANISSVTVQTSTNLKVGVTTASGRAATITTYETPFVLDIDPNIEVNSVTANLLIGTIAASSGNQPNITGVGTLSSLNVSGNIDASWVNAGVNGTVISPGSNNYVILNQNGVLGASSGLTYNGTTLTVTGATSVTGNVTAANANLGNLVSANYLSGTVITPLQPLITDLGNLTTLTVDGNVLAKSTVQVTGNLSAGNISSGIISGTLNGSIGAITPDAGVFTGVTVNNNLSADGDITTVNGVFYGDGSGLTNVNASNISGSVATANSVGHLLTPGSYLTGTAFNGSANITFAVDGTSAATANKVAIRDGSGGLSATTFIGNLQYSIANGNYIKGGTFNNSGDITLSVNASTSATASTVVARDSGGNVTANYFIGNGSVLTGVVASVLDKTLSNGLYITGGNFDGTSNVTFDVNGTTTATANKVAIRDSSGHLLASRFDGSLQYSIANGTYINGGTFNNTGNITISVNATTSATASSIVARDSSGDVRASNFIGSGAGLTDVTASEVGILPDLDMWNVNAEPGGLSWATTTSAINNWGTPSIAYGAGSYVIVYTYKPNNYPNSSTDPANMAFYSTDGGLTWHGSSIYTARYQSVTFGCDVFVAQPSGDENIKFAVSTNLGRTWGTFTWPIDPTGTSYSDFVFANDKFYTWNNSLDHMAIYDPIANDVEYVSGISGGAAAYGGGEFMGFASANTVRVSLDGINWTTTAGTIPGSNVTYTNLVYGRGMWLAAGKHNTTNDPYLAYSTDGGDSWTQVTIPVSFPTGAGCKIMYGAGRFMAISSVSTSTNNLLYSDGIGNWTIGNFNNVGSGYTDFAYGEAGFVASPGMIDPEYANVSDNFPKYTLDTEGVSQLYEFNTYGTIDGYDIGLRKRGDGAFITLTTENIITESFSTSELTIGDVNNLHISGGANGQYLQTNGSGTLTWANAGAKGSNTQVQFNDNGDFGGKSTFTFNKGANLLTIANITVSTTANLGNVGNITIIGGSAGQYLKTNGSGTLTWANAGAGGSNTQVQFNDNNEFNGSSALTFNKGTQALTIGNVIVSTTANLGNVGNVIITGGSSGQYLKTNGSGNLSWADAALFYEFSTGTSSPNAAYFPINTLSGFNAYQSTDFPSNYYTGLTVKAATVGAQFAVNWDVDNGSNVAPSKFSIRANDDTGTTTDWSPWANVWMDTNDGTGSGLDADLLDGYHANTFLNVNPDGDGVCILYSDSNPTFNGLSCGGGWYFGADGSIDVGLLDAKFFNARNGFVNSSYGYYVGNANVLSSSSTFNTTQVINHNGNVYANALSASSTVSFTANIPSTSTTTGTLIVTGGVGISGNLNATTKSFFIDHPTKPNMTLRYGSLEGPEFGVYARGKLTGSNTITLPDYWEALVDVDTTTVTLTSIGAYQELYVKSVSGTIIEINSNSSAPINCYYTVYAERKDIPKIVVEEEKR